MTVLDATWYDRVMVEPGSPAMLPLDKSPWLPMYEVLASMIEPHEPVVDLGCGTGRFVELLLRNGHYAQITGIDWSQAALNEARSYAQGRAMEREVEWVLQDLAEWQPAEERFGGTVYVCSEVMEHLEDDLELVSRIPPGHRFLFTVPNYESESHLRVFRGAGDVWTRYAGLLLVSRWQLIGEGNKAIHVCATRRRS